MVTTIEYIAGILTLTPLVIGYIMAIITFKLYLEKRSNLVLITSILFLALPSPWLGVSTVFVMRVFELGEISAKAYVFLYAWSVPIIALAWNYTAVALIKYKDVYKYLIIGIVSVLDLIFLYSIYVAQEFAVNNVEGSIFPDSTFHGLANLSSTLIVITVILFVVPLFFWVSYKTEDKLFTFKARFIGIGALLFSISAGLDANLELSNLAMVIVIRLSLVFSLFCLYLGYNTPIRIRRRYQ